MLRKKYKEILAEFVKLPYIVYKSRYLIPQKPLKPCFNNLIGKNGNIIGSFQKQLPEMVNLDLINRANDPAQQSELVKLYEEEIRKKKKLYQQKIKQYKQKYLYPLMNPSKITPAIFFFRDHREMILQQLEKEGKKYNFSSLNQIFYAQDTNTKQQYAQIASKYHQNRMALHRQAKQLYLIPEVKPIKPFTLYRRDMKNQKSVKYAELSKQVKNVYMKKAEQFNREKQKKLFAFLNDRGLTLQDFNQIRIVCKEVQTITNEIRLRETKRKIQEDFSSDELNHQQETVSVVLQEKEQIIDQKSWKVDQKSWKAQQPTKNEIQLELQELQQTNRNKQIKRQFSSEEDDLDLEQPETNIFQLRRIYKRQMDKKH